MTNTKEKRIGKTIIIILKNDKEMYTLFHIYKYFVNRKIILSSNTMLDIVCRYVKIIFCYYFLLLTY